MALVLGESQLLGTKAKRSSSFFRLFDTLLKNKAAITNEKTSNINAKTTVLIQKMLRVQLAYKIFLFMEPGFSLPSLQKPTTGPYTELCIQKLTVCDRKLLGENELK